MESKMTEHEVMLQAIDELTKTISRLIASQFILTKTLICMSSGKEEE